MPVLSTNKLFNEQRHRATQGLKIFFAGLIAGLLYPVLSREFYDAIAFVNGILIGSLGGLGIAIHQDYKNHKRIGRQHFVLSLIKTTILYTLYLGLLIFLITGITRGVEEGGDVLHYIFGGSHVQFLIYGEYLLILTYALALCGATVFTLNMMRKVESKLFWNFILGKYNKPKEEERVIMFLDLTSSTTIAEKLGEIRYFDFINEFYSDISPAILSTGGEIYRYVGDQVTVTWPIAKAIRGANCIRTYFLAKHALKFQMEKYINKYNIQPFFTAAIHCGKLIVGELGLVKSQVVFHGESMYTTALIERHCKQLKISLMISSDLMEKLSLPPVYQAQFCGHLPGEGSYSPGLYAIVEQTSNIPN